MKRPAEESEGVPGAIGLIAVALLGAGALAAVWVIYTRAPATLAPVAVPAAPAGPYGSPLAHAVTVPLPGPPGSVVVPRPTATVGISGLELSDIELRVDVDTWRAWTAGDQITTTFRGLLDMRAGATAVSDTRTSALELAPDLGSGGSVLLAGYGGSFESLPADERRLLAEDLAVALTPFLRTSAFADFTELEVVFVDHAGGASAVFVVERDASDATVLVAREERP
jgi:hypothetical protein